VQARSKDPRDRTKAPPATSTSTRPATIARFHSAANGAAQTNDPRTRRRPLIVLATWPASVISAVVVALLAAAVLQRLEGDSSGDRLSHYVSSKRAEGWRLAVGRRLQLRMAGQHYWLFVFRDVRGVRSDEVAIVDNEPGDLRQAFAFQAAPQPPRERRLPLARAAPRPYDVRLEAVTDLMGVVGTQQALLSLGGPDYHLRYPVVLWLDQFTGRIRLSPVFTPGLVVGPRLQRAGAGKLPVTGSADPGSVALAGYRLVRTLYGHPTHLHDVANREPPIDTLGAESITLVDRDGSVYLAADFVVSESTRPRALEDSDCALADIDAHDSLRRKAIVTPHRCSASLSSRQPPIPAYLNMKAWRFDHAGVSPTTTFCSGAAYIVRSRQGSDRDLLRDHWRAYLRAGRRC
jgi:hypothetical protein